MTSLRDVQQGSVHGGYWDVSHAQNIGNRWEKHLEKGEGSKAKCMSVFTINSWDLPLTFNKKS